MADRLGYVIVSYYGTDAAVNSAMLLPDLEAAAVFRDWERAESARAGSDERHVIAEVLEVQGPGAWPDVPVLAPPGPSP